MTKNLCINVAKKGRDQGRVRENRGVHKQNAEAKKKRGGNGKSPNWKKNMGGK